MGDGTTPPREHRELEPVNLYPEPARWQFKVARCSCGWKGAGTYPGNEHKAWQRHQRRVYYATAPA